MAKQSSIAFFKNSAAYQLKIAALEDPDLNSTNHSQEVI